MVVLVKEGGDFLHHLVLSTCDGGLTLWSTLNIRSIASGGHSSATYETIKNIYKKNIIWIVYTRRLHCVECLSSRDLVVTATVTIYFLCKTTDNFGVYGNVLYYRKTKESWNKFHNQQINARLLRLAMNNFRNARLYFQP